MASPFIGEIRLFAGNFAPRSYAFCDGQLVPIAQYDALFNLIGTTYGGDGETTFALPDLRGRVPVHQGTGPGSSTVTIGEMSGVETVTLTSNTLPAHTHALLATDAPAGATAGPAGNVLATASAPLYAAGASDEPMAAAAVGASGGSQPHDNMAPFLCIHFIIALEGVFPSRN